MKHHKEHIYSLEDRNESDISPLWQILQILFYTCCIFLGFSVCFIFGLTMSTTQHNCILFSNLSFASKDRDSSGRPNNVKAVNSEFPIIYCELVLYIPVVVSTFACFFAVMFAYCGRGGAGNQSMQETWRIITPAIVFNLACLCLTAYTANVFQSGHKGFLRSVAAAWNAPIVNLDDISQLRLDGTNIGHDLIRFVSLTKHATWLLVSSWGLNFLWTLLRLLFNVDFQLVRTTIHVFPKYPTNVLQKKREDYRSDTSVPDTSSRASSLDIHSRSVRLRTVQFTPSTVGPVPTPEVREDFPLRNRTPEAADEAEEVEFAEVDYTHM